MRNILHEEGKGKAAFLIDFEKCKKDKDKYSNMIQGREFGFEGQDTGFLGCMKLKGWDRKTSLVEVQGLLVFYGADWFFCFQAC